MIFGIECKYTFYLYILIDQCKHHLNDLIGGIINLHYFASEPI